jgi:general secretion pathway protein A
MLKEERNKAIRQRISVTYHIEPLTEDETRYYVRHRLKIAGTSQELFESKAVQEIYSFSQGYPRLINIICDHALLTGYASGVKSIDVNIIKECEKELHIPIDTKKPENDAAPQHRTEFAMRTNATREQPLGKKSLFLIIFLIMIILAGYFYYNLNMEESPRFGMDDIAPQEYDSPALREKESFIPGVTEKDKEPQNQKNQIAVVPSSDETTETKNIPDTEIITDTGQDVAVTEPEDTVAVPDRKTIIYFRHNSNELPDEAFETLNQIAIYLAQHPETTLSLKGYTDSTGTYSYNISVSKFRANTIKTYLVGKGVNPSNISVAGLGPENPIATNETQKGRNLNRRVEIELHID